MEQIKVGEYVRINNDFRLIALGIGKVINVNQDTICVKMRFEMPFTFKKEKIIKHSPKIIDLIEVGDYVNGYKVVDIIEDMKTGELNLEMTSDYTNQEIGDCKIYNKDIKSIVTKEQFASIKYKVKE